MSGEPRDPAAVCAQIVHASGSNFTLALRFLPKRQREAMYAIYAFCRKTDDIVDSDGAESAKRETLTKWRAMLENGASDPVIQATAQAVNDFDLDTADLHAVIDGCEMDLADLRFDSQEELESYCDKVAGAVGHLCLGVWGLRGEKARELSQTLGRAVQLTNIIRDVGEDAKCGRIYIPRDLLGAVGGGVQESEILGGAMTDNIRHCLRDMTAEAMKHYEWAGRIIEDLTSRERRSIWPALIILRIYRRLLRHIHDQDYPVFERKVRVRSSTKALIAARVYWGRFLP